MQEYFNTNEAAEYCGYAPETFRRHMKRHPVPKYGPKRNRIKRLDLDIWMEDQDAFKVIPMVKPMKGTPKEKTLTFDEMKQRVMGTGRAA